MNTLYNPDQKSKDEIISEFVVRRKIFEEIMRDLEGSKMQHPEQHYIIVGQRGMGKTTLLLRLKYAVEDSVRLQKKLIPVSFTEEQYQFSELANLWEYVGEYLQDYHGFEGLYDEIGKFATGPQFEEQAYEMLDSTLINNGKKIVLLIDNIDGLLKKLQVSEVQRLREILQTNNNIRIIGGSASYIEAFHDYHQPFYEFFKVIRLDGLNKEETIELLLKLGEIHGKKSKIEQIARDEPGRIETLRILTGGVPRTISILFGIFIDHAHEHAIKDLYRILDLVTPLYKHRMDDLPVQQQKIVDAVARHWEPITVKELSARTRLMSKTVSAQLNQLEKDQVVIKNDTSNKNKTYFIRERFWNIWYLMRYGKKNDKEKIIWLVKFLDAWLSDDDLKERIESFVMRVKKSDIDKEQLKLFSKVYASLTNLSAVNKLKLKSIETEMAEEIQMSDEEWYQCAKEEFDKKNYYESMKCLVKVTVWNPESISLILDFGKDEAALDIVHRSDLFNQADGAKMIWVIFLSQVGRYIGWIKFGEEEIDYQSILLFLSQSFKLLMGSGQFEERNTMEMLITISCCSILIKEMISNGLYHSVYKIVDESSISEEGKTTYLKDKWKPLYLAIKYLYQPDELEKQPSELSSQAFSIVKILTEKEEAPG